MTAFALAWRSATRYKARAVLATTGVAIIGALNFDMLLLSRGLVLSFADMLNSVGFDVRVMGSSGLQILRTPVTGATRLADDLRRLPEVEDVAIIRVERASIDMPNSPATDVALVATSEAAPRGAWRLVRGTTLPSDNHSSAVPPVVIARRLASRLDLEPESTLQLRVRIPGVASALPPVTCRVVGIADFSFAAGDEYTVATTMQGFDIAHGGGARPGHDEADIILVRSNASAGPDAAVAAIAQIRPDVRVYSNQQVIADFNRNGFAYFRQISLVLSTTTVVFSFLLVATLLTVSVNQRLGEVAALRALGIARRRIASMLLWESALLVGIGGILALPIGAALAIQLDSILRRMPGLPERLHFFVFEPRALVLHASLLAVTAIVAALYPIRIAATLPIAETLRREVIS